MKRSNRLLSILAFVYLLGLIFTDRVLVQQYARIDLSDPYKNFESVAIAPFRVLNIRGGNGYAIHVKQGQAFQLRIAKSRKSFLRMQKGNDTLSIQFTVANQQYQAPEASVTGLIITVPQLAVLNLSGTNNEVGPFRQDSLKILQDKNTVTRLRNLDLQQLTLHAAGISNVDFHQKNNVREVTLSGQNQAIFLLEQVVFQQLAPLMQDSSRIVFNSNTLAMARNCIP